MNRRTLLKSTLAFFATLGFPGSRTLLGRRGKFDSDACKIVVFGVDGLRIDTAEQMRLEGSPALSMLEPPLCALSGGGHSVTQSGWASIWTGLPSYFHKSYSNDEFGAMPFDYHIMGRLIASFQGGDFYPVWITGKGHNIMGSIPDSPHYQVYEPIVVQGHAGVYHGDQERENDDVFNLAVPALQEAVNHEKYCCFIHFQDPDCTGHVHKGYNRYMDAAREVDVYVSQLMQLLTPDTKVIYCSDHGFNFIGLGEVEDNHSYAPKGMLATNFPVKPYSHITRETIGRLIYQSAGFDPDHCLADREYAMYGVDIII